MCALESDLDILQQGDETEIGEKGNKLHESQTTNARLGINLSGGQKARVSLARAVYQNSDLYLLDDPLSAVDSHVGRHIFDKVIGPKGMLRNKTRILVTHGITFLKDVDLIVHVDEGRILEMGSYNELLLKDEKFADLITEYEKGQDSSSSVDTPSETPRSGDQAFEEYDDTTMSILESGDLDSPTNLARQMSTVSTLAHRQSSIRRSITPPISPETKRKEISSGEENPDGDKLIQAESIQTGRVKMGVYLVYMR
jgi:ABC-type proline/glycine betaine transport system ATPase subunit